MFKKALSIFVILSAILGNLSPALAVSSTDEFNPNYILSDEELRDWKSMTTTEVQSFLEQYNSSLSNMVLPDKDYNLKKPSEIICQASADYKINPKYLLVKLQKEQSLITAKNPTENQLNGATGYGITDGCGWNCESYLNNQGFGKQVDSAAGIMDWYYQNKNSQPWIKTAGTPINIDGQTITPATDATAFLYTYTPHLQGNKNFWKLWREWFTTEQSLPDGSLVKSADNPTVYLIQDGQKRAFKSTAALVSRYNPKLVITLPTNELDNYGIGNPISLPNYSILKEGTNYYLVDYDFLRPFANFEVVKKLGYNPDEFVEVTSADIANYKIGSTIEINTSDPIGRLVKLKEDGSLYYLKDGFYHPVYTEALAKSVFPNLSIEKVSQNEIQNYQPGPILKFKDGTLIGIKGSKAVYVIEKGKKRPIVSEEVFNGFGYDWKNVVWVDDFTAGFHDTGESIYLPSSLASILDSTSGNAPDSSQKDEPKTPSTTKETNVKDQDINLKIIENGQMVKVSEKNSQYIGEKITTNVNTYLIADYTTGKILAGKNIDTVRPLASFTKVMTAYTLMKKGLKLYGTTTYNSKLHKSAHHDFRVVNGEKVTNEDLMYSFLISSLNTPGKMLASNITKTEKEFVTLMNKQAKEMGLTKTKFTDTYGYDLGNVGTAREYLELYTTAEKNTDIRRILGMKNYSYNETKDLDKKPKHYDEHSNKLVNKSGLKFKIISSKTGYLDEAGSGVVMLIQRPSDSKQFIVIAMGNPDYTNRFVEPEKLANYTITNF